MRRRLVRQWPMKVSENQEYMASDRWKCLKSPSGAHHWIVESAQMTCKYCESSKTMDTQQHRWTKPEIR
jgi:hypothetical protein